MHRRFFLKACTAGTALSIAGGALVATQSVPDSGDGHDLTACFSNRSSAERIGRCVLRTSSEAADGRDQAHYLRLIEDDLAAFHPENRAHDLVAGLRRLIRRDYAEDRMVCVNGWFLSVTEARLCAAAALS